MMLAGENETKRGRGGRDSMGVVYGIKVIHGNGKGAGISRYDDTTRGNLSDIGRWNL